MASGTSGVQSVLIRLQRDGARALWDGGAFALVVIRCSLDWSLVLVVNWVIGGSRIGRFLCHFVGQVRRRGLFGGVDGHDHGSLGPWVVSMELWGF